MSSIRSLVSCSALLAATSFAVVMVVAPVETDRVGARGYDASFGLNDQIARMRLALANARDLAAQNIAERTVAAFPGESEAWLWKVQVEWSTGRLVTAAEDARRLETMVTQGPVPSGLLAQSSRAYRLGWANWVLSRQDAARNYFLDAATLYESGSPGFASEAIRQYNIACYLGMGGRVDDAAQHFALAVDAGYGGDGGWWQVDPDLTPIRKHPVYQDAALVLERRARQRQREREERRLGGEDPWDGAWLAPEAAPDRDESPDQTGSEAEPASAPGDRPGPWRNGRSLAEPDPASPPGTGDPARPEDTPPA